MSEANKSHRTGFPRLPSRPLLIETTAFTLYFFTWKLCMAVTLARAPRLAEVGVLGPAYALLLAFTGLGYVLFWVAHSYLPSPKERKSLAAVVLAFCFGGSIVMMTTQRIEILLGQGSRNWDGSVFPASICCRGDGADTRCVCRLRGPEFVRHHVARHAPSQEVGP